MEMQRRRVARGTCTQKIPCSQDVKVSRRTLCYGTNSDGGAVSCGAAKEQVVRGARTQKIPCQQQHKISRQALHSRRDADDGQDRMWRRKNDGCEGPRTQKGARKWGMFSAGTGPSGSRVSVWRSSAAPVGSRRRMMVPSVCAVPHSPISSHSSSALRTLLISENSAADPL